LDQRDLKFIPPKKLQEGTKKLWDCKRKTKKVAESVSAYKVWTLRSTRSRIRTTISSGISKKSKKNVEGVGSIFFAVQASAKIRKL
jgi:hypothetical protein